MSRVYKCVCLFAYLLSLTRVWKNKRFFAAYNVTVKENKFLEILFLKVLMSKMNMNADWKLFHCDAPFCETMYHFLRQVKLVPCTTFSC
jgi:hypothetical protein